MANQFLSLSLFIMLLSFFIILNTMASFDEDKSNPVIKSLNVALSAKEIEENIAQSTIPEIEEDISRGSTIDRVEALFNSNISGLKVHKNSFGNEMYVTLPLEEFESVMLDIGQGKVSQGDAFGGITARFMPVLVSLLKSEENDMPYRMDILLNIEKNPAQLQNKAPEQAALLIEKSATFTKILEEAGLPKMLMSTGIEKGQRQTISLSFKPYVPYSPIAKNKSGRGQ